MPVVESVFERFAERFPPGHARDSSSFPISQMLYALARLIQPSTIVEVGTWEGATSIWLARAVEENKRGVYVGYEIQPQKVEETTRVLQAAVPDGRWVVKPMNVLDEPYIETDFLFLDHEKTLYQDTLAKALIPVNGYVIAHDTAAWPHAIQFYRQMKFQPTFEVVNIHTELGLMIARRIM